MPGRTRNTGRFSLPLALRSSFRVAQPFSKWVSPHSDRMHGPSIPAAATTAVPWIHLDNTPASAV